MTARAVHARQEELSEDTLTLSALPNAIEAGLGGKGTSDP
jgi:hypothetical protein